MQSRLRGCDGLLSIIPESDLYEDQGHHSVAHRRGNRGWKAALRSPTNFAQASSNVRQNSHNIFCRAAGLIKY